MQVIVLLADGFEETEVVAPVDLLRRGGVDVVLAGVNGLEVRSSHNFVLRADRRLHQLAPTQADMVFVPGGLGGVNALLASPEVCAFLRDAASAGLYLAAICAGPTVLSRLGLIDGKRCVCYPGCEGWLEGALFQPDKTLERDGKLLTAQAAGSAFDLGLAMLAALRGEEAARQVGESICYRGR